jgi:hypothetical protein
VTHPPAAVAYGDQMHARMIDLAHQHVKEAFDREGGVTLTDYAADCLDIGIGAGIAAAMQVLIDMGLLETAK